MSRNLLILSGPTHEYLDPVRFIGNASSGLMGKSIAEEAVARGFRVTFISGPVHSTHLPDIGTDGKLIQVTGAAEMLSAAEHHFPTSDVIIFAAAVADYTPVEKNAEKMAKSESDLTLHLKATPDIAKSLCASKTESQTAIGFALQTHNGEQNARRKLREKKLNGIVLNTPSTLGAATGTFSFLSNSDEQFRHWGTVDKATCAKYILDQLP